MKIVPAFASAIRGAQLTLTHRQIRRYAMIPWGIAVVVYGVAGTFFFSHLSWLITYFTGTASEGIGGYLWYVFAFVGTLIFCVALSLVCLVLVMLVAGAFQSAIIAEVYRERGVESVAQGSGISAFVSETLRTAGRELLKLVWVIPLAVLAFILGFVPPLAPLGIALGAWLFGYQFIDAALDVRGEPVMKRLGFSASHAIPVTIFGLAYSVLSIIPFGLVFAIPAASAGAADLVCAIRGHRKSDTTVRENRANE
jgi:CysZ protein